MNISFTWHRITQLKNTLLKNNINFNIFLEDLKNYILKNFNKGKNIFFVWWSDWFDNIIGEILAKNWFKYILMLSKNNENYRYN